MLLNSDTADPAGICLGCLSQAVRICQTSAWAEAAQSGCLPGTAVRGVDMEEALVSARAQSRVCGSPPQRRSKVPDPWVVIFTALGVEYEAIRQDLADPVRQHEERGTVYEVGMLPAARGSWRVALAQTGPGSTAAGVQLERAVQLFAPEVALFLGVAGGRKDVMRGDVVVADTVYDYEWGKSTLEGYLPRIRTHFPAYRLVQRAQLVARESRWQRRIQPSCPHPPPASFVKPIVTGAKVVTHNQSEVACLLDRYASDALAIETEGHGFLEGAYANPSVNALVIRGISDLLIDKDKASDAYWQATASRHATAFAIELLDSIGAYRSRTGFHRQDSSSVRYGGAGS